MSKILITGGAGYIGSHIAVELHNIAEVHIIDNLSNSTQRQVDAIQRITKNGDEVKFHKHCLTNSKWIDNFIRKDSYGFYMSDIFDKRDTVIHCVSNSDTVTTVEHYYNNIVSTMNLLLFMKKAGMRNLIYLSSDNVYNNGQGKEGDTIKFSNYRNNSTIMIEQILKDFAKENPEFKIAILRCSKVIGNHKSGLLREHTPNIITDMIFSLILKIPFQLYYDNYKTPDGAMHPVMRDYIHIKDIVNGCLKTVQYLENDKTLDGVHIFNLGSGVGYTDLELVEAFENKIGVKLLLDKKVRIVGDKIIFLKTEKAIKELDWKAEYNLDYMMGSVKYLFNQILNEQLKEKIKAGFNMGDKTNTNKLLEFLWELC